MITILNLATAEAALDYSISFSGDLSGSWLSANPSSGSIPVGDSDNVTITVDTSDLDQGDYTGSVVISSNDLDDPEEIVTVDLTVVYGDDMKAVSINSPVGVVPSGSYNVNATVQNLGFNDQDDVLVNCSVFEGGLGGTVLFEDFSSDPSDWTITTTGGSTAWEWDSVDKRMEHSYEYGEIVTGYLDSPVLDCSGKSGMSLSFWHDWKADYSGYDQDGFVRGSTDGGVTFPYLIDEFHDPDVEEGVKEYDISSWADGQSGVVIRFEVYNDYNWHWYVDDFNVTAELAGDLVYSSEMLVGLDAYESMFVEFSPGWNPGMGLYGVQVSTLLAGDENSGNDVVAETVSVEGPGLSFDPGSVDFGTLGVNESDSFVFEIWNGGVGVLEYDLSVSEGWLSVSPVSGSSSGEHDDVVVSVNTSGLAAGGYSGEVLISSDGGSGVFGVELFVVSSGTELLDVDQSVQDRPFLVRHASDGDWGGAQGFVPSVGVLSRVECLMKTLGTPSFDLVVELREGSVDGTLLDSITMTSGDFSSDWEWVEFDFVDVSVAMGTEYVIVLTPPPSGVTNTFGYGWGYALSDMYDDGSLWFTRTSGSFWLDLPDLYDFTFRTYGYT